MTSVSLEELCSFSVISADASRVRVAALAAYLPVGIIVVLVRFVLHLLCAAIYVGGAIVWPTPDMDGLATSLIWLAATTSCIRVQVRSQRGQSTTAASFQLRRGRVLVSNHLTQFDALFLRLLCGCRIAVALRETYRSNGWLLRTLTNMAIRPIWVPAPAHTFGPCTGHAELEARRARASVRMAMRQHVSQVEVIGASPEPLVIFPEGSITNGGGLMRFARGAFELDVPVQPVALRVFCPLPLAHDTVWSSLFQNYLRTLFQPWMHVEVTVLPVQNRTMNEDAIGFAHRTSKVMEKELRVPATTHTTADKAQLLHRVKAKQGAGFTSAFNTCRWVGQARGTNPQG
mmetsp:Transcript_28796/g.88274  ORF Transcript_28796/g.88274 Transcript_28796/m.88274 type:complete len:345 (-) Transcript_28796:769-1803(-)